MLQQLSVSICKKRIKNPVRAPEDKLCLNFTLLPSVALEEEKKVLKTKKQAHPSRNDVDLSGQCKAGKDEIKLYIQFFKNVSSLCI